MACEQVEGRGRVIKGASSNRLPLSREPALCRVRSQDPEIEIKIMT